MNEEAKDRSVSSTDDGGGARDGDGANMQSDADTDDAPPRTVYPSVPGTQCNRLPLGSDPVSVLGQPARGLERTAEARYGRDYAAVAASCARVSGPVAAPAVALPMEQRLTCISSGTAVQIGKQVRAFYKGLDDWEIDDDVVRAPGKPSQDCLGLRMG